MSGNLSHDGLPRFEQAMNGSASGSVEAQSKRTRTRQTKSCDRCRSKKLRCDREFPCGSCKKGGKSGNDCSYRDGWEPEEIEEVHIVKKPRVVDGGVGMVGGGNLGVVEKMVRIGEAMGGAVFTPRPSSAAGGRTPGRKSTPAPASWVGPLPVDGDSYLTSATLGRLDVKGHRSRYVAPGDKMSIMDHVSTPTLRSV